MPPPCRYRTHFPPSAATGAHSLLRTSAVRVTRSCQLPREGDAGPDASPSPHLRHHAISHSGTASPAWSSTRNAGGPHGVLWTHAERVSRDLVILA